MKRAKNGIRACAVFVSVLLTILVGCTNTRTGNTLFRNSLVACSYGTHYGYCGRNWENKISPVYDYAYNFNEFNVARVKQDGKYGLINSRGIYILEPIYDYIGAFSENGLAPFITDNKVGYLTVSGETIIPPQYSTEKGYSNFDKSGICVFYQDSSYGLLNEFGQIVLDPKFESIVTTLWDMNLCGVRKDGKYALYNSSFSAVTGFVYDSVMYGGENTVIGQQEGLYYYLNPDGTKLFDIGFEKAAPFSENGLALVYEDGLYGYINRDGRYELDQRFTDARSFSENGLAAVRTADGTYGYIDRSGVLVIKARFLSAGDFISDSTRSLNLAVAETEKGFGVINESGRFVVRPSYSTLSIRVYDDDIFAGITSTGTVLFSRTGKVLRVFGPGEINLEK